jgi:hypothetical protein
MPKNRPKFPNGYKLKSKKEALEEIRNEPTIEPIQVEKIEEAKV